MHTFALLDFWQQSSMAVQSQRKSAKTKQRMQLQLLSSRQDFMVIIASNPEISVCQCQKEQLGRSIFFIKLQVCSKLLRT